MAATTTQLLTENRHEREQGFLNGGMPVAALQELALAPLVDKIAYGLARGLVVAVKELEDHIASETRKVADGVGKRLDTLQASFQDLSAVVSEQRSINSTVQEKCRELASATAFLKECDARLTSEVSALREDTSHRLNTLQETEARQAAELSILRSEAKEFSTSVSERIGSICKELGVQQEDIAAIKTSLSAFCSRVDAVSERLDRQAEALRSMCATYAQRESELEQLVDGLARLRACPAPKSTNGL
jgi:chromosome segregation ATPase